jgi:hypothetical protein
LLHDLKAIGRTERWRAGVDISCSGGYDSTGWDIYETEAEHSEAHQLCHTTIPEGPDVGSAEVRNLGGHHAGIEVRWDLRNLDYRVYTLGGFGAGLICGTPRGGIASDATYEGAATIFVAGPKSSSQDLRVID